MRVSLSCSKYSSAQPNGRCFVNARKTRVVTVLARSGNAGSKSAAAKDYSKDVTGLSSLRFAKPEGSEMEQLMSEWRR